LAALACDRTTNAIANLSESSIRSRLSSGSVRHSVQSSPTSALHNSKSLPKSADSQTNSRESTDSSNTNNTAASSLSHARPETADLATSCHLLLEMNPPSHAHSNTATDTPAPITFVLPGNYNKMRQTSSRLMRMTSDDRPFTKVTST
jgi:GTPase-activating protein SST2